MSYRLFDCNFWEDPYVEELPPHGKLMYAYCFTNKHTNQAGIYELSVRRMSFDTGLEEEEIKQYLRQFEKDGKIRYVDEILWVKNFVNHQATISPKILTRIAKDLKALKDHTLVTEYLQHNEHRAIPYQYPMDTVSID